MQHILVHDKPRRVLNFHSVSVQTEQLCTIPERVPSSIKFERQCQDLSQPVIFLFLPTFEDFLRMHYIHIWEMCIPRSVQAKQILIGRFVECQSIKNVCGRRS